MAQAAVKELASRNQNGLEVTLLWEPRSNEVSVEVIDQPDDTGFSLPIAGHLARDAFHHPYAYAQLHEDHCDRIPADDLGRVTGMTTLAPATTRSRGNWTRAAALQPLLVPLASLLLALTKSLRQFLRASGSQDLTFPVRVGRASHSTPKPYLGARKLARLTNWHVLQALPRRLLPE